MTTTEVEDTTVKRVAAKAAAAATSGEATFASLMHKPRRSLSFDVTTENENGDEVVLKVKYRAISSKAYDDLIAEHPPTPKEKSNGGQYNSATFPPALIAAVSAVPTLTLEQAQSIYSSDDWSGGEAGSMFMNAVRVCQAGLDVPFNVRD
jgi:hypothetical protein